MSAATVVSPESPVSEQLRQVTVVSKKFPTVLAAVTVLLLAIIGLAPRDGSTSFRLSSPGDLVEIPAVSAPAMPTARF